MIEILEKIVPSQTGDPLGQVIDLFDDLTDGERVIVMDGFNQRTGKKLENSEK
jgi:hypothetical protein